MSSAAYRAGRTTAVVSAALLALTLGVAPVSAAGGPGPGALAVGAPVARPGPDREALRASLDAFRDAGMYGSWAAVREGSAQWRGATGVADKATGRPTAPDLETRVGSITKTFTAVALLQQVERGRLRLDEPIGRRLPDLVTDERARTVTVRMLLDHTSGIGDYVLPAFPGILDDPRRALDAGRFRRLEPEHLARLGLAAPPAGERGRHNYSNTNYILAGLILERVTGQDPETYISRHVIRKAGLEHTRFPTSPRIEGPHARLYESFHGHIDPPRDYSVYDMSWGGTAGALVSTTTDLNSFYRQLLGGRLLGPAALREMKTTVPAYETEPGEEALVRYGLGIFTLRMSDGRDYWGHNGGVFGGGTWAFSSEDGRRQVALGYNLTKYERFDEQGEPLPDPIGEALFAFLDRALSTRPPTDGRSVLPAPGALRALPADLPLPRPGGTPR
ncbi:serine hydrolase domain-containing protein (plasmid) [Streptomyces sp. BI20]|uniref:serine hydrolase domain-containing protein n=1 Tax=Streptomyces sp. BI20 TaxID=3403460 RepID=UPI003C7648FC